MHALNQYLAQYFLTAAQLADRCRITSAELSRLVEARVIPAPSYVVAESFLQSFVMGKLAAPGATDGDYHHPSMGIWVKKARRIIAAYGLENAPTRLREDFDRNMSAALAAINETSWRLVDCFRDDGVAVAEGLRPRLDVFWLHFLKGTYGLCVAAPDSEAAIAHKEVLQERLVALTENGATTDFSAAAAGELLTLIDAYDRATMPFSPVDYPRSSRKRLVDDLRARLITAARLR